MKLMENIILKDYLTMKIGGKAKYMANITSKEDIIEAHQFAKDNNIQMFILGGGSNTLARDDGFDGIVLHMDIKLRECIKETQNHVIYRFGAGEILDEIIQLSVDRNLSGIEAMSLIPGTIGAAPVQNVGAYGQEIADTFVELTAYDLYLEKFVTLSKDDCQFSYRHSIFRGKDWGRYIITDVTLRLNKSLPQPPFYAQVQDSLDKKNISSYTPQIIRDTVIEIRENKLPDPQYIPSCGSFFKNAIISEEKLHTLKNHYPELKGFHTQNHQYKISTGWLIDKAGLKGKKLYGMKIHDKNALVLINESAHSYHSLAAARDDIIATVENKFGITIQQEVLEM